ncbi:MAG: SIMPL domain-containing protein [Patescibacteria group bacterium]
MKINNLKLKDISVVIFLGFLMLIIFYSLFWGPARKLTDSLMPIRTISVSSEGKTTVEPDIAKISFSVVSEGVSPEILVRNNVKKMNAAIDFIKSKGIDAKDIKTTQYDLRPRYEYDEKKKSSFISGYQMTQTVLVKIRDLIKPAEILGGLPELGINQIDSIAFEIDDQEKYLAEARNQAFAKARQKAEEMAKTNNVKLGKIINFSEYQNGGGPIPYYYGGLERTESVKIAPSIQPGTQEITVSVNITYQIK